MCDLCAPCWLYNRCKWCLNQETHSIINSNFFSMEKRLTNFVLSKLIISIHLMAMLYICIQQSFNLKNWLLAGLIQGIGLKKTVTLSHWVYDNFLERFITALVVIIISISIRMEKKVQFFGKYHNGSLTAQIRVKAVMEFYIQGSLKSPHRQES